MVFSPHFCLIIISRNFLNHQRDSPLPHTLIIARFWRWAMESMTYVWKWTFISTNFLASSLWGAQHFSLPNWAKEYRLDVNVFVDDVKIQTRTAQKYSVLRLIICTPQPTAIITKVQSRNKIRELLADKTWDKDKETLLASSKVIGWLVVNYAVPILSPGCSRTKLGKIQSCQNTALRTVTGFLLMYPIGHLSEVRMLPLKEHNPLLWKQVIAWVISTKAEPPPRNIKRTIPTIHRRSTKFYRPSSGRD